MPGSEKALVKIRRALDSEPRLDLHRFPLRMELERGALTLEGEVENIAVKKRVLERAAALPEVDGIVDRLHVAPSQRMGDSEIRVHVTDSLLREPVFAECRLRARHGDEFETLHAPDRARGEILVSVADGVVTLDGDIPSLSHKRLAGVLAWWVPGSRDVVNGLGVEPPEEDNDDEVSDAVRLVLEKDPFVDASKIRVQTRDYVVTLEGLVPTQGEREMAEFDAWYVFGVDDVVDRIEVRP